MSRFETVLQPFAIANGQLQQASDLMLAVEPASALAAEARKGRLYIVAEPAHASLRERDACVAAIRTLRKVFYDDSSYSVTSALRKAIVKANDVLYQQNFNRAAQKRVYVGVTCVVIKEQRVYIAQVQPAQAYLLAEGKLRSLPPNPSWGGSLDVARAEPKPNALGASLTIEPTFYQSSLRGGDALLVCSSPFVAHLRREGVEYLLHRADPQAIVDELLTQSASHDLGHAHGLVLRISDHAQASTTPAKRQVRTPAGAGLGQLAQRLAGRAASEQTEKRARRQQHAAREQEQLNTLPEDPLPAPRGDLRIQPIELGESLAERVGKNRDQRTPRLGRLPARESERDLTPSSFLGEGDYVAPQPTASLDLGDRAPKETFTSYARRTNGELPDLNPTLGERLSEPLNRAVAAARIANANRQRRRQMPPTALPPKRRNAGLSYRKEGPRFPWALLSALVLLIALLVVLGNNLLAQNTQQQKAEVLIDARAAVGALRAAPDEATAIKRLEAAGIALDTVRASGAISESQQLKQEFLGLEREYERVQSSVQRVSYLDDLSEIGKHPQADGGATFTTLVIPPPPTTITDTTAFESMYALDSNVGVIYQMPKTGGTLTPMLQPDQVIANGVQAGRIKAVAWRFDNIVAIGQIQSGYVYYFRNAGAWNSSNLGGSTEWRRDIPRLRFVTYGGNLYFWGPQPGQVLKYASGRPGDLYTPWISDYGASSIESALDLAVDGNLYLLRPDGRIQVFAANAFVGELPAPKVDPPIAAITEFVATGDDPTNGSFFFMDQNRVVQADKKTGAIIQQLRVRPGSTISLKNLSAITVDTSGPQPMLYMVAEGRILRATVPQPPKPFQPGETAPTAPPATTAQP